MQTRRQYLRGWFLMDLIATVPVDWITDNLSGNSSISYINKLLRMLRLFKLFRIIRLLKLAPKLFAVLETSIKVDPELLKFARAMVSLVLMWHLMGT